MKETRKKRATGAAGSTPPRGPAAEGPTSEAIAQRAYEIFLARGAESGREQEDWLQAEKELRERAKR